MNDPSSASPEEVVVGNHVANQPDLSLEHPAFPQHRLRVVEPTLCDPSVKQFSGYLDISETRHLFFWFEESRNKPSEDPLVLW